METLPNGLRRNVTLKFYSYFKILLRLRYRNTRFDCVGPHFIKYLLAATYTAFLQFFLSNGFVRRDLQIPTVSNRQNCVDLRKCCIFGKSLYFINIYCKHETYPLLDIVSTSYSLCQSFIISLIINQKTRF